MKKIYTLLLLLAAATMSFVSCTPEVDDAFGSSATERSTEHISEVRNVLTAQPNGWLIHMYGDLDFGGYNLLCKFSDNQVEAVSEIDGSGTVVTSHYKLDQSSGTVLSFDEYNKVIHFFSDPVNPAGFGQNGKGFKADLEYRILSATADSVVMTGKKHGNRIVMKPAPADKATYLADVQAMETKMLSRKYKLVIGTDSFDISKSSSIRNIAVTDTTTGNTTELPYTVTDKGYSLYKPTTFHGATLSGFVYSPDSVWVDEKDSNVKLIMLKTNLNELFATAPWFAAYSNMGTYGKARWDTWKTAETGIGEEIAYAIIGPWTLSGVEQTALTFASTDGTTTFWSQLGLAYELIGSDKVKITDTGKVDKIGNGTWYKTRAGAQNGLLPFIGTFTITVDNELSPAYVTLTDDNNPANVIKLSAAATTYPFRN